MSKNNIWMPLYWADYYRDTQHLDTTEHGAYMMLIGYYWSTGGNCIANAEQLHMVCRCKTDAQRHAVDRVVAQFFTKTVDNSVEKLVHKRLNEELQRAENISKKRAEAAKKRHNNQPVDNYDAIALQLHTQSQSQSQSQLQSEEDTPHTPLVDNLPKEKTYTPGFVSFEKVRSAYPRKVGLYRAQQVFMLNELANEADAILSGIEAWKDSDEWQREDGKYIPKLDKFLEDRRWIDAPAAKQKYNDKF